MYFLFSFFEPTLTLTISFLTLSPLNAFLTDCFVSFFDLIVIVFTLEPLNASGASVVTFFPIVTVVAELFLRASVETSVTSYFLPSTVTVSGIVTLFAFVLATAVYVTVLVVDVSSDVTSKVPFFSTVTYLTFSTTVGV